MTNPQSASSSPYSKDKSWPVWFAWQALDMVVIWNFILPWPRWSQRYGPVVATAMVLGALSALIFLIFLIYIPPAYVFDALDRKGTSRRKSTLYTPDSPYYYAQYYISSTQPLPLYRIRNGGRFDPCDVPISSGSLPKFRIGRPLDRAAQGPRGRFLARCVTDAKRRAAAQVASESR